MMSTRHAPDHQAELFWHGCKGDRKAGFEGGGGIGSGTARRTCQFAQYFVPSSGESPALIAAQIGRRWFFADGSCAASSTSCWLSPAGVS